MILGLGLILLLVVGAFAIAPKRPAQPFDNAPRQSLAASAPALLSAVTTSEPRRSLREVQVSEEAEAIARVYRERADAAWLAKLRTDAAALLGDGEAE
jgi:hypothetical protein